MVTVNQKLGLKIKRFRKERKLSQEELAFRAKLDYSYLNEIEAGKRNPSVKRVAAIAHVLNVSLKQLFDT
jgi:transcriptional regulator with XRE-family HTH domain